MDITQIQKKVGHNSQNTASDKNKFQMLQGIFTHSAMIYKNHGKSDDETAAMLKKDFMLNEQQTRLIMEEISGKGGNVKCS